jgi:predicted ATP-grasp superfamily ATP-dependent carboligase
VVLEYHRIKPFTGRPMKGWKKDIEALEKRVENLERDVKKCLAAVEKPKRKKRAKKEGSGR